MYIKTMISSTLWIILNLAVVQLSSSLITIHNSKYVSTFLARKQPTKKARSSSLYGYGIHEWRDNAIVMEPETASNKPFSSSMPSREICLLPFSYDEILLQGETKELRLYEERFIKLFEKSMNEHGGIIGMALLVNDSSILKPISICEIESYNKMSEFGIFCTIRVISRATIVKFVDYTPYITAICVERMDDTSSLDFGNKKQLDLFNYLASNIENTVLTLSSLQHQLSDGSSKEKEEKLEKDVLYDISTDEDEDYDDEEEEDEEDPISRFRNAFHAAKESDYNGYTTTTINDNDESSKECRSIQDLTAISWAAFCCFATSQRENIITYRIQVLDSSRLLDRLYMGIYILREKRKELEEELASVRKKQQRDNENNNEYFL